MWKARTVEQPKKEREIGEVLAVEHRFEIELDVCLAANQLRVAEQPEDTAVGNNSPQELGTRE